MSSSDSASESNDNEPTGIFELNNSQSESSLNSESDEDEGNEKELNHSNVVNKNIASHSTGIKHILGCCISSRHLKEKYFQRNQRILTAKTITI